MTVQLSGARSSPEGVQDGTTWLLASNRLELEEGRVGLLLQRGIESSDGNDEAGSFLSGMSTSGVLISTLGKEDKPCASLGRHSS